MSRPKWLLSALVWTAFAVAPAAHAATVRAVFKGHITDILAPNGFLDSSVTVGTDYAAIFNMDAGTPDDYGIYPNTDISEYLDHSTIAGAKVTFGDYTTISDGTPIAHFTSLFETAA